MTNTTIGILTICCLVQMLSADAREYVFPPLEGQQEQNADSNFYHNRPTFPPLNETQTPTYATPSAYQDLPKDFGEPSAGYGEPSARYKEPSARYKAPSARYKESSARYKEPSARYKEPSARYKVPSARYNASPAEYQEPQIGYGEYRTPSSIYPPVPLNEFRTMPKHLPRTYGQLENEYEREPSSTFFQRPGYTFPPLEDKQNRNAFANKPIFPPQEKPMEYDAYQETRYGYHSPAFHARPSQGKPEYRNRKYLGNDFGKANYYDPYSHINMPFQTLLPAYTRYNQNLWSPFNSHFNQMPFYNQYNGGDFRNMRMPGFFSK